MTFLNNFFFRASKFLSRHGIGAGKKLNLNQLKSSGFEISKLHLGCGNIHINGWCNVDVIPTGATDLVMDIMKLPGLGIDSVSNIYSCHVLEHFSTDMILPILSRWYEVLSPGGEIRISVPDLDAITRIYQKNLEHFQTTGNQPWIALIYGGQKDLYDFHKTGFNYCWLEFLLEKVGFVEIERYPQSKHFIDGLHDNSMAKDPFGEYISINVKAIKK